MGGSGGVTARNRSLSEMQMETKTFGDSCEVSSESLGLTTPLVDTCCQSSIAMQKQDIKLSFFLQRMNIKSSVYSLEVIFPADFTPPLPPATEKRNIRPIRIFGKEEIGYERVIWKHLWPQSLPPLFLLGSAQPSLI